MYNITVMDQYSPANVTVPANMSSAEISQFPDNGTSVVANRQYTITVSAISDQGISYPSDVVGIGKFLCTYVCICVSLISMVVLSCLQVLMTLHYICTIRRFLFVIILYCCNTYVCMHTLYVACSFTYFQF